VFDISDARCNHVVEITHMLKGISVPTRQTRNGQAEKSEHGDKF